MRGTVLERGADLPRPLPQPARAPVEDVLAAAVAEGVPGIGGGRRDCFLLGAGHPVANLRDVEMVDYRAHVRARVVGEAELHRHGAVDAEDTAPIAIDWLKE